jgi:hypothetical protein
MLKLKSTVTLVSLQGGKETKTMDQFFQRQLRQATRAWLRAVIERIPRYTGTARASFKPLGRVLRVHIPKGIKLGKTDPKRKLPRGRNIQGKIYPSSFPSIGQAFATFRFYRDPNSLEYVFEFDEYLPYVIWNDIYPAPAWIELPSNPPWHAFEAGANAFNKYIRVEMPTREFYKALKKDLKVTSKTVRLS